MKNEKIILIETSDIGARYSAQAIRRLGFDPVFLVKLQNYQGDTLKQIKEFEYFDVDTTNVDKMFDFISNKEFQVKAVTTFLDSRLHLAIELANRLGVKGLDDQLLPFKDKGAVYDLGEQFSPSSICFSRDNIPIKKIEKLRQECQRVIVKPRCTAGGIGAKVFEDRQPIFDIVQHLSTLEIPTHLQPTEWMAQGFIEGELVSAEGFIRNGVIKVLGFTGRRKVGNTESWSGFPYCEQMPLVSKVEAQNKVLELMKKTGVQNAFFHIEFIVDEKNAYVIDANLGRLGGGGIGEILATSFQVDPVDIFLDVLKISLFPELQISEFWNSRPGFAVSVNYGVATEAVLLSSEREKMVPVNTYFTKILDEESVVPSMGTDNWAWVGIVSGSTVEVQEYLQNLRICTSVGEQDACYAFAEAGL